MSGTGGGLRRSSTAGLPQPILDFGYNTGNQFGATVFNSAELQGLGVQYSFDTNVSPGVRVMDAPPGALLALLRPRNAARGNHVDPTNPPNEIDVFQNSAWVIPEDETGSFGEIGKLNRRLTNTGTPTSDNPIDPFTGFQVIRQSLWTINPAVDRTKAPGLEKWISVRPREAVGTQESSGAPGGDAHDMGASYAWRQCWTAVHCRKRMNRSWQSDLQRVVGAGGQSFSAHMDPLLNVRHVALSRPDPIALFAFAVILPDDSAELGYRMGPASRPFLVRLTPRPYRINQNFSADPYSPASGDWVGMQVATWNNNAEMVAGRCRLEWRFR